MKKTVNKLKKIANTFRAEKYLTKQMAKKTARAILSAIRANSYC